MAKIKKYYNENKHIFEIIIVFFGIGALFLAIPESTKTTEMLSLKYLKLGWLVLIIFGEIIITYHSLKLIIYIEQKAENNDIDFDGQIFAMLFWFSLYILYTTSKYTWHCYHEQITHLLGSFFILLIIHQIMVGIHSGISKKIYLSSKKITSKLILNLLWSLIISSSFAAIILTQGKNFETYGDATLLFLLILISTDSIYYIKKWDNKIMKILSFIFNLILYIALMPLLAIYVFT